MYPIVVFSKGKPEMTYTAEWFKKNNALKTISPIYVLSPGDDRKTYEKTTGCESVIAKGSHNLASKRQWALDNLTSKKKPWLIFFEDNILRVTGVDPAYYEAEEIKPTTRALYHDNEVAPDALIDLMLWDIELADKIGTYYGGYACNDNHFFRSRKYRTVAFVWTKMAYVKRGGPKWPTALQEMDDYGMTAATLKYCGRTLVNNFLYPWPKRYEGRGGSRTLEERAPDKRRAVQWLLKNYPGLFRIKERKGRPSGTEIQLRFTSEKQVQLWRESF